MRQTIYDALEDVFGDNFTPDELERMAERRSPLLRRIQGRVEPSPARRDAPPSH
jgi:hypothetical protein